MKKLITTALIAAAALNPVASMAGSHTAPRDKHHIASIHFTKDKTKEAVIGGEIAITAAALWASMSLESSAWGDAHPEARARHIELLDSLEQNNVIENTREGLSIESLETRLDQVNEEARNVYRQYMNAPADSEEQTAIYAQWDKLDDTARELHELIGIRKPFLAADHFNQTKLIAKGSGVTIGTTIGIDQATRTQALDKLHGKDGKTIHYRYDGKKTDKEVRTEIKRWLQKKSYLKGFKINTDKFDHGTHTYTYKAADTWITVTL